MEFVEAKRRALGANAKNGKRSVFGGCCGFWFFFGGFGRFSLFFLKEKRKTESFFFFFKRVFCILVFVFFSGFCLV